MERSFFPMLTQRAWWLLKTFLEFDLVGSSTNHNHEEIIENIETYQCVAIKSL